MTPGTLYERQVTFNLRRATLRKGVLICLKDFP